MEIYKYSKGIGGLTLYFPLFFLIFSLGSIPLFYVFYNFLTPLLPTTFKDWSTITFILLILFFGFYLIQIIVLAWFFSFFLSEKFTLHQKNQLINYKRTWPFKFKKVYELSEVQEIRIKSAFIPGLFKIELKGEVFLVLKYTFSFEKAKKVVNNINLMTGLPIKDEV